jgi:hypothetical protein
MSIAAQWYTVAVFGGAFLLLTIYGFGCSLWRNLHSYLRWRRMVREDEEQHLWLAGDCPWPLAKNSPDAARSAGAGGHNVIHIHSSGSSSFSRTKAP